MKKGQQTNVQLVTELMNYSRHGALAQAFVMEALRRYSEQVAKLKPSDFPRDSIIAPDAWISVAKEVHERIEEHLSC